MVAKNYSDWNLRKKDFLRMEFGFWYMQNEMR